MFLCDREIGVHAEKHLMGRFLGFRVFPGVVGEFCEGEKHTPVVLPRIGPSSEVLLDPGIHSLRLTIGSWVEHCAEVLLDP
jgi:hypothetical protein